MVNDMVVITAQDMILIEPGNEYDRDGIQVFFDGIECGGEMARVYVCGNPDEEVVGWAEFYLKEGDGTIAFIEPVGREPIPMTVWRKGKVHWSIVDTVLPTIP